MFAVRIKDGISDSVVTLETGRGDPAGSGNYGSPLTTLPESEWQLTRFRELVGQVREAGLSARLELIRLDAKVRLRVCRLTGPRRYRILPTDVSTAQVLAFLRRRVTMRTGHVKIGHMTANMVTGINSEKLLHEWLSHPLEGGIQRPAGVSLTHVFPAHDSTPEQRLVCGSVAAVPTVLPARWLLIRTVEDGWFDYRKRRVFATVGDGFVNTGDLIQSVHPFSFSVSLEDMDRCFAGAVSKQVVTGSGYYCSKFGEHVFGRIFSPALLFASLPLTVEE